MNKRLAQAARRDIEAALEDNGWPWSKRLSLWWDSLIILEEAATSS